MISNKNYSEAERLLRVVDKRISGFVKLADDCAHYEPVAWWFTRNRIGRDLREQYKIPTELPSNLLAMIRQLDAIEGNHVFGEFRRGDRIRADSPISTQDLVLASERSIAELDAPAPITGNR